MNVIKNVKKGPKPRKSNYYQNLQFQVVGEGNQKHQKTLAEITKDNIGNTTNSRSSGDCHVVLSLTEGRGHAKGEVGIAALDVNSPTLIISQISDNLHYSDTLNKILILNPTKILLPDTIFETAPLSKLVELIKENFGHIIIYPLERRFFNDKQGLEDIARFCSAKSASILPVIAQKYYCLSSVSALLKYLKDVNCVFFADNCLKVEYQTKQGGMMIDNQTASRLELLYSLSGEKSSKKFSLYSILNYCETRIGQRHLRANILEPSCSIDFIRNRQEQIKVLMENDNVKISLRESLQKFRSVDQLLKISCIPPADDVEKAIETNIQLAILLKQCLEAVKPLQEVVQNTFSDSFEASRQILISSVFPEIIKEIDKVLQPDIHMNRMAQKHFVHLYAVKAGVNDSIDVLRKLYTDQIKKIRDYADELTDVVGLPLRLVHSLKLGHHLVFKNLNNVPMPSEVNVIYRKGSNVYVNTSELLALNNSTEMLSFDIIKISNTILCNMLVGIAKEIDSIHHLICAVIDLDLVQSLTEASSKELYCCPSFGKVMRIENAFHPMLEISKNNENVIENNIFATPQYNFFIISGPNMSGKTIYIKMIAILQIMAQIGCFIPGSNAILRMTDKLFSRIGFEDNLAQHASSFTVELREMEYIYSNLTPNSLVIMDELCRSTNPQEGEQICWTFCEKLLKFIGVSDDNYFELETENEDKTVDGKIFRQSRSNTSLQFRGCGIKIKDVARPFIYLTTHFTTLTKIVEKYNNALNLHMEVEQRTVEESFRLEFTYKIRSGPTEVKSYGLALARCLRFPSTLIDRAEEMISNITDESYIEPNPRNQTVQHGNRVNDPNDTTISQEITELDSEVVDVYSFILLLMSTEKTENVEWISVEMVNQKLEELLKKMTPELQEMIRLSPLEEIIRVLNASTLTHA